MRKILCAAVCLLLAAAAPLCAAQPPDDPSAAMFARIDTLRRAGDYAGAATLAAELLELTRSDTLAFQYEIDDAERLLETLQFVSGLPEEAMRRLATADSLAAVGETLWESGSFGEGEAALERELELRRDVLGPDHGEVATTLNNLAAIRASRGDLEGAERLYAESLDLKRQILGGRHPEVAFAVNNAASLCYSQGDYAASEALFREALGMLSAIFGEDDPVATSCLLNLAGVMSARGDYVGAEPLYRRALSIRRRVFGPDHLNAAAAMNSLAGVLKARGDYAAAEPLYREALAIRRRELGESHPSVAQSLNNLAASLYAQGRYGEAEPLFREALAVRRETLGDTHPQVAQGLNNLAAVLYAQDDYAGAETLYEEALEMRRNTLGDEHPLVASSLYNLGVLQKAKGDYERALETLTESARMRRELLGEEHPDLGSNLFNLAETRYLMGDCASADSLYRMSLAVRRVSLGHAHPHVADTLRRLGICLKACGDYASAESVLEDACRAYDAARLRAGVGTSRATFIQSPYADLAHAKLALGKVDDAWPHAERALARTLTDLLAAASARDLNGRERATEDSLSAWVAACEREIAVLRRAAADRDEAASSDDLDQARTSLLEAEAGWSAFQRRMSDKYPVTEGRSAELSVVQATLPDEAAIVGWVDAEIGPEALESWGYVVREEGPVFWALLGRSGEGYETSIVEEFRLYGDALSDEESTPLGLRIDAAELWRRRFGPLQEALEGVTRVSLVASGASIGIPLETLVDDEGLLLCERYRVSYVPSCTLQSSLSDGSGAPRGHAYTLLLGDPPFEGVLPQLPGTRDEVLALSEIVDGPTVLVGRDASEESLVRLTETGRMGEFAILHLATHAHVDDRVPGRSSLVLSQALLPDPVEAVAAGARVYDGILTAREIVREWNLDADLVTLSACETALGREAGGEGYIGLAHAFMQAGARSLLVSLWKVEDRATSLLMRRFYRNLASADEAPGRGRARGEPGGLSGSRGKAGALRDAKMWLRDYTDESGRRPYAHPFYWSAFVLVGDGS